MCRSVLERSHVATMAEMVEEKAWNASLKKYHNELRTGIIVANVLPALRLLLTDVEYLCIGAKEGDVARVDELVRTLLTKDDSTFDGFCSALEENGYGEWSRRLKGKGTTPHGVPNFQWQRQFPIIDDLSSEFALLAASIDVAIHELNSVRLGGLRTCIVAKLKCKDPEGQGSLPNTPDELMSALQNYWDFLNFEFAQLVVRYLDDEKLQGQMRRYEEIVRTKVLATLEECKTRNVHPQAPPNCVDMTITVNTDAHSYSLHRILQMKDFLMHQIGLNMALFAGWEKGSIKLHFYIAAEDVKTAQLRVKEHLKELQTLQVTRLVVFGIFYFDVPSCKATEATLTSSTLEHSDTESRKGHEEEEMHMPEPNVPFFRMGPSIPALKPEEIRVVNESTSGHGRGHEMVPYAAWNRVAAAVVLIKTKKEDNGTGFLYLLHNTIVLCTANHVLVDQETAKSAEIWFDLDGIPGNRKSIVGEKLFDVETAFYHSPEHDLDYTMIPVRKDELATLLGREVEPLKFAGLELNRQDALYIMHYPLIGGLQPKCFNGYHILDTIEYVVIYETSTEGGSSGAPLIKVGGGAGMQAQPFVVGIHKGTCVPAKKTKNPSVNFGIKLQTVMNHINGISPPKPPKKLKFKMLEKAGPSATYEGELEVTTSDTTTSDTTTSDTTASDTTTSDTTASGTPASGTESADGSGSKLDAKPTELQLRHHVVRVVPPSQWRAFCQYLGLSDIDIGYSASAHTNTADQFNTALLKWRKGKGKARTWHTILTAFTDVDLEDDGDALRKCILDGKLKI